MKEGRKDKMMKEGIRKKLGWEERMQDRLIQRKQWSKEECRKDKLEGKRQKKGTRQ